MKNKKIRQAKVTLYIENVPAFKKGKELDEYEIVDYIESILKKNGITCNAPGEAILGEIETITISKEDNELQKCIVDLKKGKSVDSLYELKDDVVLVKTFKDCKKRGGKPVGFISPEGSWYLLNSEDDGLAHLTLASAIYKIKTEDGYDFPLHADNGIDNILEANGFIKVHGYDIRYLAHFKRWNIDKQLSEYTPDPTPIQIKEICKYMRRLAILENDKIEQCCVNDRKWVKRSELLQMEPLMVRDLFKL